ncbi:hypothetical protein O0881_08550 [Janthinobacterium sp. SUN100]|uniref:hypothetical protein n=1 Tax=Janthinobacterium sp. SUN100 TaxID=3004101 RepID=UPI0025AEF8E8|nr:hypothetical protein [Janthinobacterium sp. SUN100]MDN2702041.1 hypothetical protein [Janthinobacterium sp. SUN100]
MKSNELNTVAATVENFPAISKRLPFGRQQSWNASTKNMASYLCEHANNGAGLNSEEVALFATGRLDWLLRKTRPTLSGLFSERDIIVLLNCFQGDLLPPDQVSRFASNLCHELGIELDEYESSGVGPLINKLLELTSVQQVALADVLEQLWHRGMSGDMGEFLASMDIDLV